MKKVRFFAFFIAGMIVPFLVSAQSAGDSGTAIAKTEETRQKAIDFESHSYFPSEWEAAEAQYTRAKTAQQQTAYEAATGAYESIFLKAVPLYAQAREDEVMALRNNLVAAGARDSFPQPFALADETALTALNQYEAQEYYPAKASSAQAFAMYQALTSAYNAWLVRYEIEERDFAAYDPDNFDRAREILSDAMDAYGAGNYASSQESAEEALLRYNLVLSTGWAAYAELRSSFAESERQAALDIKANIATKDLFTEADSIYKTAVDSYNTKDYEEASKQFTNAEILFITVSVATSNKRRNATSTIREAYEKIEESDENARQAEIILEGGSE
jgi:hypothetical protein